MFVCYVYINDFRKISSPMAIRITPPRIDAFPARCVPAFFQIVSPAIHITKVTTPMIIVAISAMPNL